MVKNSNFLISGQRCDVDIKEEINFNNLDWKGKLREKIKRTGKLHGLAGMDYFVFPSQLLDMIKMPKFIVGRPGLDNWLIYRCRSLHIPIIDATKLITIIHQNHDYSHSSFGKKEKVVGPETQKNLELAGGFVNMCTLRDADWILTSQGLKKPPYPRRIFAKLSLFYPWRKLLGFKRKLQSNN